MSYSGELHPESLDALNKLKGYAQSEHPEEQAKAQWPVGSHFFRVHDKGAKLFPFILDDNAYRIHYDAIPRTLDRSATKSGGSAGRAHAVPLNEIAVEVLKRQLGRHDSYVFTYQGHPIANVSTKAWWAALKRAGIEDFRWHDLRHTFATWHRQAGTPTHELQKLGGWKTLSMVERYAHVAPEGLQTAAARLDGVMAGYARTAAAGMFSEATSSEQLR
ncbi:site-specific integrase [Hydrogenophaga sp. SNF1]|uniref:tyrosine-type recombinase/integrase n=1 Tax=Hydrogenophaga sp. SNF1 TaxID=3098762 RepID=UPI002ACC2230|nr:site-specific integrase [Hydrogenophaga sp. SNF1]WQB82131.1 site-specific integrase [Hydrogenophaga sp. SNF1]